MGNICFGTSDKRFSDEFYPRSDSPLQDYDDIQFGANALLNDDDFFQHSTASSYKSEGASSNHMGPTMNSTIDPGPGFTTMESLQNTNDPLMGGNPRSNTSAKMPFPEHETRSRSLSFGSVSMNQQMRATFGHDEGSALPTQQRSIPLLTKANTPPHQLEDNGSMTSAMQNMNKIITPPQGMQSPPNPGDNAGTLRKKNHKKRKKKDRKSVSFNLNVNDKSPRSENEMPPLKNETPRTKRKKQKSSKKVGDWSVEDCRQWVVGLGAAYSSYGQIFLDNGVDGSLLIDMFDSDYNSIGITHNLHVKKLQQVLIKKMNNQELQQRENTSVRSGYKKAPNTMQGLNSARSSLGSQSRTPDSFFPMTKTSSNSSKQFRQTRSKRLKKKRKKRPKVASTTGYVNMMQQQAIQQQAMQQQQQAMQKSHQMASYGTYQHAAQQMPVSSYKPPTKKKQIRKSKRRTKMRPAKHAKSRSVPPKNAHMIGNQMNQGRQIQQMNNNRSVMNPTSTIAAQGMNPNSFQRTMPIQGSVNQQASGMPSSATASNMTASPRYMTPPPPNAQPPQQPQQQNVYKQQPVTNFQQQLDPRWAGVYE